ncbi:Formate/nitrite transporter [Aureobasidium pullulans]|uniref:Formate/nitrite transporter n=1 Tax=Aureobasidium pullulans TaxID=5580 RepID=A0A4S9L441_AURPU|nr:Formate/nitrite transporter [Aureobasidium pullulans]
MEVLHNSESVHTLGKLYPSLAMATAYPYHQPIEVIHNAYTAQQTTEIASRMGTAKANMRVDKIFTSSFMAGAILAFACAAVSTVNTAPWYQENAPGVIKLFAALIFPFGLVAIILTGADLATGSFMFTTLSTLHRRTSVLKMLQHWVITFFGNLAGSLFVMAIIAGYGEILSDAAYRTQTIKFATTKVVHPPWHAIFIRGIGANWLVCLACFLACGAREMVSKIIAIWWPTFAFVILGFDHVIANMFYIPMAIFLGAEEITVGLYIWKSMIPALLGNIVGGGLFVGVVYWYLYLAGNPSPILIDGSAFGGATVALFGVNADVQEERSRRESDKTDMA